MAFPPDFRLILASQSPRRHSLLRDLGIPFRVVTSTAEERLEGAPAPSLAESNAVAKVMGAALPADVVPGTFVLGTDTLVASGDWVMGKPVSREEARRMLQTLSGRTHQVVSGVALARVGETSGPIERSDIQAAHTVTDVAFTALDDHQIDVYLASGEWRGKAGAYAIQGWAGLWVSGLRGEYSNVVGLPLHLLTRLFGEAGFDLAGREWRGHGSTSDIATHRAQ